MKDSGNKSAPKNLFLGEKMKDSGNKSAPKNLFLGEKNCEWIGEIPDNWKVVKNNRLFHISKMLVGDDWDKTLLLSLSKGGIIPKNINDCAGKQPESFSTYQYVKIDDIVLCLFDIDVSAVFSDRSSYNGMISPAYKVMKCSESILPVYAKWWFDAVFVGRYYLIYTKSLRKTIDSESFGNILTVVPPLSEQKKIADYLDDRCSKIDELITGTTASIEDYKKLKQAIITEAVTKGLNKDVLMKDTGIDWIGEIPKNWELSRVKNECDNLDSLREPIRADKRNNKLKLYDYYGASGVIDKIDDYNVDDTVLLIGEDGANLKMRNLPLVYMATGKFWVNNHAHILKVKENRNNYKFMAYLLEAGDYNCYITGSAQPKLSQFNLMRFHITHPPLSEQKEIANYLDKKIGNIDDIINEKTGLIEDLKAYKKSLIYEVVTGKKRIK